MNKKKYSIIAILCLVLCIVGGVIAYKEYSKEDDVGEIYEEIQETFGPDKMQELDYVPVDIPIDFASLKDINEDVYAWIDIPDTKIHYPILQHPEDDTYYLDHTIEGKSGLPGSIYTEKVNAKDFSDFNTVIYGHNMKNGTMFKHLHKFEETKFFEEHDTFTIYTETAIKNYQIVAAVLYNDRHIMKAFDQSTTEGRLAFIKSFQEMKTWNKHLRKDVVLDENSRLVTLSTCVGGQPNKRYIVIGKEIMDNMNK